MACEFCDVPIYTKIKSFSKSLAAPVTPEGELRQRLEDKTGEIFAHVQHNFCPMCGAFISGGMYDGVDLAEGKDITVKK